MQFDDDCQRFIIFFFLQFFFRLNMINYTKVHKKNSLINILIVDIIRRKYSKYLKPSVYTYSMTFLCRHKVLFSENFCINTISLKIQQIIFNFRHYNDSLTLDIQPKYTQNSKESFFFLLILFRFYFQISYDINSFYINE